MKYANIKMHREGLNNLGDNMQLIAINNLLRNLGVKGEDIVRIDYYDLSSYDGEYVILPINYPFYGYRNDLDITMFSPKIIPVFLGLSIMSNEVSNEEVSYLKKFEPIGCRDEYTMNVLRKKGIFSYLNGCITATFPKIYEKGASNTKIFFVDVPESFMKYVPFEIKEKAEIITQMAYYPSDAEQATLELYQKYIREAEFVVTTRLHCAVPCMAAGIPVILVKDEYSFRFPWLNKLLSVYTEKEYFDIDWDPRTIDYEEFKQNLINSNANRLKQTFSRYKDICDISFFYENKEWAAKGIVEHADTTIDYIKRTWNKDICINYSFWGITQPASLIYQFISKNYPNARLKYVFDQSKRVKFCGIDSMSIEDINDEELNDTFIFVTSASAYKVAEKKFIEKKKENYYQCSGDKVL